MGGIYIAQSGGEQRGLARFTNQHPADVVELTAGEYRVWVAGTWAGAEPCYAKGRGNGGEFLAVAGSLIYKGEMQQAGARRLLEDLESDRMDDDLLFGAFAVAHWNGSELRLFSDWMGSLCIYRNSTESVWSTSFLATAASCETLSLNIQGAYEYLFQESTFGVDTVCAEVARVAPDHVHNISKGKAVPRRDRLAGLQFLNCSVDEHIERVLDSLNSVFDAIVDCFGDRIDTAISGGYDSRLILALLRARGVRPRLHVYGASNDQDVLVAKAICDGEGLSLVHIDKSLSKSKDDLPFREAVARNFLLFDGYPIDGIFDSGVDLSTRTGRMADQYLLLNGGGGEVFRNFYYLPDRAYHVRELLHAFYSRFDPTVCTSEFVEEDYYRRLEQKVIAQLGTRSETLSRLDVERTYPLFRCRFWMARNTSVNCRLGYAMTPLIEPSVVRAALGVPMREKNLGNFEAALIRRIDPRLAAYATAYGRSLDAKPLMTERIRYGATAMRPPALRRLTFRLKHRFNRYFNAQSIGSARTGVPTRPRPRKLFRSDEFPDRLQFERSATLQYLLDFFGMDLSV